MKRDQSRKGPTRPSAPAESVVEFTINALREAIRQGDLAQGQRLVVADVTKMLGVSNGPVREAIRRLTGEGLVEIVPHRGAAVRTLTGRDIQEIFQVREVLEGLTARLSAARIDSVDYRARLEAIMKEMRVVAKTGNGYIEHNHAFHELFYEMAANERLREQARQLTLPIYRLRLHYLMAPDYARISLAEHEAVAKAVLQRDGSRAERLMRKHVRNSGVAMLAALNTAQQSKSGVAPRAQRTRLGVPEGRAQRASRQVGQAGR
jgi:DNA-binding GntR family transcriptional regulator